MLAELDPYAGELGIVGAGVYSIGAFDRYRGMLHHLLGRHDQAVAALDAAVALERAVDGPVLTSRSQLWLARALRSRGGPGDLERARAELAEAVATAEGLGQAGVERPARALLAELGAESPEAGDAE